MKNHMIKRGHLYYYHYRGIIISWEFSTDGRYMFDGKVTRFRVKRIDNSDAKILAITVYGMMLFFGLCCVEEKVL